MTDGWYGVRATIDGPLSQLVASGALRTGPPASKPHPVHAVMRVPMLIIPYCNHRVPCSQAYVASLKQGQTACAGMKVRVCRAELRGGQPQAVLEAARSCSLHFHCNGVHRSGLQSRSQCAARLS